MDFTNSLEITFFGMRRSGNHAVINWIRSQTQGTFIHLNNVNLYSGCDPYQHFTQAVISEVNPLVAERGLRSFKRFSKYLLRCGKVEYLYGVDERHSELIKRESWRALKKILLVRSYEHYSLQDAIHDWFEAEREQNVGRSQHQFDIVLVRDPYNLFASLIKTSNNISELSNSQLVIDKWKEHAKEYLGYTNHLKHQVGISYNAWFQDQEYRRELADRLKLTFTDDGMDSVPMFGKGSSFDGQRFDGNARKMGVLSRYKHFLDHPVMEQVLADQEIRELSYTIFGDILEPASLPTL